MSPTQKQFERIGEELIDVSLEKTRGLHKSYCAFDRPQNSYFVSSIASESTGEVGEFTESKPNLIGLKIRPESERTRFDLQVSFEVYVPSFPTQAEYEELVPDSEDGGREFRTSTSFFRRVSVEYATELDISSLEAEADRVTREINEAIVESVEAHLEEHVLCRDRDFDRDFDLSDRADFESLREEIEDREEDVPEWEAEFALSKRRDEVTLRLANRSPEAPDGETDQYIFNPGIRVNGEFKRYTLSLVPEDFRYERDIWAKGQNCSVDADAVSPDGVGTIETTAVPEYQSYRFKQNDEYEEATSLDRLGNPSEYLSALEELEGGMSSYLSEWRGPMKREREDEFSEEEMEKFLEAADAFEQEIQYYRRGIEVLSEHEQAERAFTLMNEAFANQDNEMANWYPFQLVFIVSNLGAVVAREVPETKIEKDEEAEVLWFPTGGGKTEAYLGLIVFSLLFDRLRGKERGVTAWIRFPLRLLGKQQKDRFLTIMHEAELLRQTELEGAGEPFSIGYFVGSHDTPNSIHHDGRNNLWSTFQKDEDVLEAKCGVVEECPECGGPVEVEFDPEVNTVYHLCADDDCIGRLNLFVTDHDIYRNVPSVLLGTLDKISIAGANPRFANLLGNFTDRCPTHGLGYAGKCSESSTLDCDEELEPVTEELYDPIPTLHLVDEVHLLNEELGVFAGQYETFYQELCRRLSPEDDEPKILTSTATIAEYEEHMENLFLKDANRFPEEGPTINQSFYGSVDFDDPERRYIGVTPVNKTHIYAVLDLVKQYHQTIRDFRDGDSGDLALSQQELEEVLDVYELSVVYFLRKTRKDRFLRSIENQINREMKNDGYQIPLTTEQLTADIESTTVLNRLQDPNEPFEERTDTVAATSFIGHGIDVDRFNTMFFFGFPSETFQYIQSSARVGRKYPGTVVNIFRPYDERDKHRYKYFGKTHEYLRRSVEAVSIDRWSKFSLEKTFPGIYKAILLQYFRPVMHSKYGVNVQSSRELQDVIASPEEYPEFSREEYEQILRRSFGVHKREEPYFERRIDEKTEAYWEHWVKKLGKKPYTTIKEDAMRSLRDIGEQVEIAPDNDEISFYENLVGGD